MTSCSPMDELGDLKDGDAAAAALLPLTRHYRDWIAGQRTAIGTLSPRRRETAEELLRLAAIAADRIELGIAAAPGGPGCAGRIPRGQSRRAQGSAPQAGGSTRPRGARSSSRSSSSTCRALPTPTMPHRETVDLLYFPTGGGKTEAYLGLSAFAIVLRRLRHPADDGRAGAGVCVVMRYTLRLLTLDQLSRAAGLLCALELEREDAPERYGTWPFEIGLWVGKAATPNVMGRKGDGRQDSARIKVRQFKADPHSKPSPIPLEDCPWCGDALQAGVVHAAA